MRKILLITAALIVAGFVVYLGRLGNSHQVVVDSPAPDSPTAVPLDKVEHSVWDRLLKKYVDGNGMVNYAAWKASAGDSGALKQYLAALGRGDPHIPSAKQGRLAFWINAYNALTVYGILEVYPTSSIRNHTAKVLGYNIWRDLLLPVAGRRYSLDNIEHGILRKLDEPRIHFAVVCASIGCPRLRDEAYAGDRLEHQLADNTRDFFSRPGHFRVDAAKRIVYVSPILRWFGEDFGPTPGERLKRLVKYLPAQSGIRQLIERGDFSVAYLDYDWNLNDQQQEAAK